jgi:hypothetical protein
MFAPHSAATFGEIEENESAGLALTLNPLISNGSPAGQDCVAVPEGIAHTVYVPGVAPAGIATFAEIV